MQGVRAIDCHYSCFHGGKRRRGETAITDPAPNGSGISSRSSIPHSRPPVHHNHQHFTVLADRCIGRRRGGGGGVGTPRRRCICSPFYPSTISSLRAKWLSAVCAYNNAHSEFDNIVNSPLLDVTCEERQSVSASKVIDPPTVKSLVRNGIAHDKLESDLNELLPNSMPLEKVTPQDIQSISYQNSKNPESQSLDFRGSISILEQGIPVSTTFYVPLLKECIDQRSVAGTRIFHTHIIKTGIHQDLYLSTSLINVYAKCGAMDVAHKLFDKLPCRNIVTWTALITGYAQNSQSEQAVQVFIQLLESGTYPTNYTLGAILSTCCSLYALELGKQIHGHAIKYQVSSDTSVGNSLCSFYSKCRKLESTLKVFKSISDKNVISWTTTISACSDNGHADLGLKIFIEMLLEDAKPNEFTLTSAMSLCCAAQALGLGEQIHCMCIKFGCQSSLPVRNSIMYLYLKCGRVDEARRSIENVEALNLITWNAMIAGHAQMMDLASDDISAHSRGIEALAIFLKLNRSDMKPDLFSFSSILAVCSGLAAFEQGEQIHAQVLKAGCLSDVVVGSALVNMYSKCGSIEKASKAFVEMPTRTLISWTSMIGSYSQHGRSKEAILLFEDMGLAGLKPNQVTFVGVLSACSQAGMVDEAQHYFKMMKREYRIKPVMDHYACMVDMFVRLGRLEEANEFIKAMSFEPNEVIWSILIAGCRSHGKMELAFYAADQLLKLKPKGAEIYILLMNMYISAERWQDVSRVRKVMKEQKIVSIKDWSWISIKDKVYSFKTDDRSHPRTAEIYRLLENLLDNAEGMGYVAHNGLEMMEETEEEKTFSFQAHHSERLAIAFGLLNTAEGVPVRVVKNIGMCRDCHSAIKFFSRLVDREIIVRDSRRLHRFSDGQCSCGDFAAFL